MKKKYRILLLPFSILITLVFLCALLLKTHQNPSTHDSEDIHVTSVICGQDASRTAMPFIKSLLFHRRSHLHLHIITDKPAFITLSVIFQTWDLEDVSISFYLLETYEYLLLNIPNKHHSGLFGLTKLIVEQILPAEIHRVIVLDTDIVVMDSLHELWKMFGRMRPHQFVGLVENLSNYYVEKRLFSLLVRGYNTGVMLMDLSKMREMNWGGLWRIECDLLNRKIGSLKQADQDIMNSYLEKHPSTVYPVTCVWNYQISAKSLSNHICSFSEENRIRIVHWNSPQKHELKTAVAKSFEGIYLAYSSLDGRAVERRIIQGPFSAQPAVSKSTAGTCSSIHEAGSRMYRTHPFYIPSSDPNIKTTDITLVAQLSIDRLPIVEKIARQWKGPMSIAIYTIDYELEAIQLFIRQSHSLSSRQNIAYHLVFRAGDFYPVNYLRNVAMNFSLTETVFFSDADFLPMKDLDIYLRSWLSVLENSERKAFIVPAFETLQYRFSSPGDKPHLIRMWEDGLIDTFRHFEWPRGHAATNYTFWRESQSPYKVEWDMDYEPYVLLTKKGPLFDTRFVGFGWNKVSFIIELDAMDFEFWVLPDVFMIHLPHSPSLDVSHFRDSKKYRICLQALKEMFLLDLVIRYGTSTLKYAQFEE